MLNLRAIAGEYDFQARHLDLAKLPVFIENQAKGDYKVYLDPGDYGGDMIIKFNLSYEADPEIAQVDEHDRLPSRAVARDRPRPDQRDVLARHGHPGSVVPADSNKYNPGPQYRKMWATLDVKKANEMLDKIGLDQEGRRGLSACARTARGGCASRS